MVKVFSIVILSLMVGFIHPLWATSGKSSGGISQENMAGIKQKTNKASSEDTKHAPQGKDEAAQNQNNLDTTFLKK